MPSEEGPTHPDKRPTEFFRAQTQITMHQWATTCHLKHDLPQHTPGTHEANTLAARGTLIRLVKSPKMFLRGHLTLCALQAENMHPDIQVPWLRGHTAASLPEVKMSKQGTLLIFVLYVRNLPALLSTTSRKHPKFLTFIPKLLSRSFPSLRQKFLL